MRDFPLQSKHDAIKAAIEQMIKSGEIDQIITNYFTQKNLPIPNYK